MTSTSARRPTTDAAKEQFANLKAELYWALRERFADGDIAGLTDRTMRSQLAGLRYQHDTAAASRSRRRTTRSSEARSRPTGREALMLAYAPDHPAALRAQLYGLRTGGSGG